MNTRRVSHRSLLAVTAGALTIASLTVTSGTQPPPGQQNPFRVATRVPAPTVLRADLQACNELARARPQKPGAVSVQDFSRAFNGTWIRELTWHGTVVTNESAMYFTIDGGTGKLSAMMYDISNLEKGPMHKRLEALRQDPDRLAKTTTMTFVNCRNQIVDKYYRISEGVEYDLGARAGSLTKLAGRSLKDVFEQMRKQNFFGLRDDERSKVALFAGPGEQPLNEVRTPSVGGGFWEGSVTRRAAAWPGMRNVGGLVLQMKGTYEGSHVGLTTANGKVTFEGTETAVFFREGNSLVASMRSVARAGLPARSGTAALEIGGWTTDCADFFNLNDAIIWERVVLENGGF
jgi:hypothetical protein